MVTAQLKRAQQILNKIADEYYFIEKYGLMPTLEIDESLGGDFGQYDADDKEIVLSNIAFYTQEDLTRTILHEATHFIQDMEDRPADEIEAYESEEAWKQFSD